MLKSFISRPVKLGACAFGSITVVWLLIWLLIINPAPVLLWEIGKPDRNNLEFALSPNHYKEFKEDGLFVVGQSESRTDWPYVHPGPANSWAGNRQHTFRIIFGLKSLPSRGKCRLQVKLTDTHKHRVVVRIGINGRVFDKKLARGAGGDSPEGQPDEGKPYNFNISFGVRDLKAGDNEIRITNLRGSFFLYDWLGLEVPRGVELQPVSKQTRIVGLHPLHVLQKENGHLRQNIRLNFWHFGHPTEVSVHLGKNKPVKVRLRKVSEVAEVSVPAVKRNTELEIAVVEGDKPFFSKKVTLKPIRKMTVFILPHSHTDVGYTDLQTTVEQKQMENLLKGIEYARNTAHYPRGSRFVWNVETLWAADLLLRRSSQDQQALFFEAVKKSQVALNGMYLNELTGLCRPEELLRIFRFSTKLAGRTGVKIDSAMISDVPGCTWGTVTALAQAGIKYLSTAPNYFDRIGDIMVQWENRPFYWVSPSGKEKVLVWIPYKGYALSHLIGKLKPESLEEYQVQLEQKAYPFDMAYIRWSGQGDNAAPDPSLCEFVKNWNSRYLWPKIIIASTHKAFQTFERRYGDHLPKLRGDWTPYWEDGAGSTAAETAMNRNSSDRLTQAEALWAMLDPTGYPARAFEEAWRNILLFSEHTWGADCSVSDPESQKSKAQWEIKKAYAVRADHQSRELLARALEYDTRKEEGVTSKTGTSQWIRGKAPYEIDVFNTTSWPRTDLICLSRESSADRDRVTDLQGRPAPSQRLNSGELAFVARDLPPYSVRRYRLSVGAPFIDKKVAASETLLDNGILHLRINKQTGSINELRAKTIEGNFVDNTSGQGVNDYLYLKGDNAADIKGNGPAKITIKEYGPLVASLKIESNAPGCHKLSREVRLAAGFDYVELIDTVDKEKLRVKNYYNKNGKESVNFAFPFNVPNGRILLDLPLGAMRPERDQIPGSCKNWLTVGRWADISNDQQGITWITLDAPLVQVGGITATLLNSQTDPRVWRKKIEPTQKLYSWVMNNHWGTNYRAYQEGPAVFRFILRPHLQASPVEASRLAIGLNHPLVIRKARGTVPKVAPLLYVHSKDVLVTALKPSDDGKAWIVRLFGAAGKTVHTKITWAKPEPRQIWLSDTSEKRRRKANERIEVPTYDLVTLRAEHGRKRGRK